MKRILLIVLIAICSCNTQKKITAHFDSFLGKDKSELIYKWGPPSKTSSDGKDGEILTWAYKGATEGVVIGNTYSENTRYISLMIYVDKNGKAYHWKYSG